MVLRISWEKQHEDREQDLRGSSRALIVELLIEKVVEEQVVDDDWQVSNETSTKAKSSCRSSTQSDKPSSHCACFRFAHSVSELVTSCRNVEYQANGVYTIVSGKTCILARRMQARWDQGRSDTGCVEARGDNHSSTKGVGDKVGKYEHSYFLQNKVDF